MTGTRPRQVTVLHMLVLALRDYPEASWTRLVQLTCQIGAGLDPPIQVAEVRALKDKTVGDLCAEIRKAAIA